MNLKSTFFTNFYLDVRDDKKHPEATMTRSVVKLEKQYKKLCHNFFITQLNMMNPKIIVCLGHDVKDALAEAESSFSKWKPKSISLKKIHKSDRHIIVNEIFEKRLFVLVPHPCDLRNFNDEHMIKLHGILAGHLSKK